MCRSPLVGGVALDLTPGVFNLVTILLSNLVGVNFLLYSKFSVPTRDTPESRLQERVG